MFGEVFSVRQPRRAKHPTFRRPTPSPVHTYIATAMIKEVGDFEDGVISCHPDDGDGVGLRKAGFYNSFQTGLHRVPSPRKGPGKGKGKVHPCTGNEVKVKVKCTLVQAMR